jgi:hypothetical protein
VRKRLTSDCAGAVVRSLALTVVSLTSGCTKAPPQAPPAIPVAASPMQATADSDDRPAPSTASAGSGKRREYTGISFEIPANWTDKAAQMVDSKYVTSTEHGDIEITLTSMGGGIESNLDRWVKQVRREPNDEPTWSTVDIAGVEAKQVDVRGKYASGVGTDKGTRQETRLIGIAVPLPPRDFFIKLVGPRDAMVEFDDELKSFLKTAQVDD